ncbi:MAG: hypothetical protein AAFQ07_01190, partial [Chloroflexota bacterium]
MQDRSSNSSIRRVYPAFEIRANLFARIFPSTTQVYLVIDQNKPHVRLYVKNEKSWSVTSYAEMDATVPVTSLDTELALSELYLDIEF